MSHVINFGPSDKIVFSGYIINTWTRWAIVSALTIFTQISYCINSNTVDPYIHNVIKDHKTYEKDSALFSHIVVQLNTIYDWIVFIFNTNLWVSMQIQFIITGLFIDLIVTYYMTQQYLKNNEEEDL